MKIAKLLFYAAVGVVSGTMVGCGYVDDVSSEEYAKALEAQVKETYKQAFEKTFGKIDANQSWDLSTRGFYASTRAEDTKQTGEPGEAIDIPESLRVNVSKILTEGNDNHAIGAKYNLISQGPFDIYPIWHGKCMQWELWVNDVKLGSYADIMSKMNDTTTYQVGPTGALSGVTGYHVNLPVGTPVYIKLVITKNNPDGWERDTYAKIGDEISSVNAKTYTKRINNKSVTIDYGSLVLPLTYKGSTLSYDDVDPVQADGSRIFDMIVMFEDSDTSSSDLDFNDFVLGIKGRPLPPTENKVETNDYSVFAGVQKRYMVEDLGTTDDFDFNDIVVDMKAGKQVYHEIRTTTTASGAKTVEDVVVKEEEVKSATIKHLGGTLQWQLLVNGKEITEVRNGIKDLDVNEVIDLTKIDGAVWNPETNNIQVKVAQKDGNNVNNDVMNMNTVEFPSTGAVPMMIATDTDKAWMGERVKINWGPFSGILDKKE